MTVFRHVLGGPGAAGDQWSSGFYTHGPANVTAEAVHVLMQAAVESYIGDGGPLLADGVCQYWNPATHLRDLTTYQLDPATGRATGIYRSSAAIVGKSAGAQPPPRDALVVGLRTALPGPSGRGRMYLPGIARSHLDAQGLIPEAVRQSVADSMSQLFKDLWANNIMTGIFHVGADAVLSLTGVTVGAVPGTQRRRSNKIPQAYAQADGLL